MTTAIVIVIATAVVAVALIVAAAYIATHEKHSGAAGLTAHPQIQLEPGQAKITPISRARIVDWIPVEEEKPDSSRKVLVSANYGKGVDSVVISRWNGSRWMHESIEGHVAAWAELPEPYRK